MNILYINHYAGGPEYGMAFRPHYLAKEWKKMGHNVTIVGASYSHLRKKQPSCAEEYVDGIRYLWIATPEYHGNGLGRVKNMALFVWGLYTNKDKIILKFVPDIVITSSTYPLDNLPAYRIAKECNAKFVFEAHDLWPLSPMVLGKMSKYHPFIMVMQYAENFAYRHADKVVSILPCAESHMLAHGLKEGKFIHIPNGIDISEWKQSSSIPGMHKNCFEKLKKKFIIGYAGGITHNDALIYLINAARELQKYNVAVVIVGKGEAKLDLENYTKNNNIDNVFFLPAVDKSAVPNILSYMNALYIGWQKNPLYRFGISPNKIYDYMMAGKPILHSVEAANDLVQEAHCGVSVKSEDINDIVNGIKQLMNMSENARIKLGQNGKKYVVDNFDYRILARKFIEEIM